MWAHFDGKPYSREQFIKYLESIPLSQLSWVKMVCVHNTATPNIAQWQSKIATPEQRIINLEAYYEHSLGWHAGPHGFIPPDPKVCIYGFTEFTEPGVHASCFNHCSIGLEMVGDFESEDFNSGPGAIVRDNAVFVLAALHRKLGLQPDGFVMGVKGLHLHRDCKRDNHACPGKTVLRAPLVKLILAEMQRQEQGQAVAVAPAVSAGAGGNGGTAAPKPDLVPVPIPVAMAASPAAVVPASAAATSPLTTSSSNLADKLGTLNSNASVINSLADQGSRIAQSLQSAKTWLWTALGVTTVGGGGAVGTVDPSKGSAAVLHSWLADHMALVAIGALALLLVAGYFAVKHIEHYLATAAKDGRYQPQG